MLIIWFLELRLYECCHSCFLSECGALGPEINVLEDNEETLIYENIQVIGEIDRFRYTHIY